MTNTTTFTKNTVRLRALIKSFINIENGDNLGRKNATSADFCDTKFFNDFSFLKDRIHKHDVRIFTGITGSKVGVRTQHPHQP